MNTATQALLTVTDDTFADEVLSSALPVLVDFTADWCPGCRMIAPVLAQLAAENGERYRVVTLNVDHDARTPAAYGVLATPTLMLFHAGEPVRSMVGARSKRHLTQALDDTLKTLEA